MRSCARWFSWWLGWVGWLVGWLVYLLRVCALIVLVAAAALKKTWSNTTASVCVWLCACVCVKMILKLEAITVTTAAVAATTTTTTTTTNNLKAEGEFCFFLQWTKPAINDTKTTSTIQYKKALSLIKRTRETQRERERKRDSHFIPLPSLLLFLFDCLFYYDIDANFVQLEQNRH